MSAAQKDTIYIDVDDEITAIIEKVRASESKIVALVLPKRAAVLQSTVNMRLLKRAAESEKKRVVLITSEAAILPLAGVVGVHVAKTLQSKPAIPPAPELKDTPLTVSDGDESDSVATDNMQTIDPKTPIGKLAGDTEEQEETIDVDYNDQKPEAADAKSAKTGGTPNKKLKVPNFERFRSLIILGGTGLVALIAFLVWAFVIAPKAKITVKTDTTTQTSILDVIASPGAKSLDKEKFIVPASSKEVKKSASEKVSATGQKDNGTKATGTMTVFYCPDNNNTQIELPAGTAFTNNGVVFRTNAAVTVPASNFTGGGDCKKDQSQSVGVTSDQPGDKNNFSARAYTSSVTGVSGSGSAMTGGTSKLVKALSQQDVDNAKQLLLEKTKAAATTDLSKQLTDSDMLALIDSIGTGEQAVTAAPNVGDETEEATVTLNATHTMLGMAKSDLKQLIEADIKQKIDPTAQRIQEEDEGLDKASIKLSDKRGNGDTPVNLQVQVVIGPLLDAETVKKEALGKRKGAAIEAIRKRPGVKEVNMQYSPFWVISTPKKASKITVVFEQANGNQ